jgi:hypothetical protein
MLTVRARRQSFAERFLQNPEKRGLRIHAHHMNALGFGGQKTWV